MVPPRHYSEDAVRVLCRILCDGDGFDPDEDIIEGKLLCGPKGTSLAPDRILPKAWMAYQDQARSILDRYHLTIDRREAEAA